MNTHDKLLAAHFEDLYKQAYYKGQFTYSKFHNYIDFKLLNINIPPSAIKTFGGYEASYRVVYRFGDPNEVNYEEDFPIDILKITPNSKKFSNIEHRDVLGTIMSLGLERSQIGDICFFDNCAYIFALNSISQYIISEIHQIKKMPVKVAIVDKIPNEIIEQAYIEKDLIIASERLDCFISAVTKLSRSKAENMIIEKKVLLNGIISSKKTVSIKEGDIIVIRGFGKFIYFEKGKQTGSGNLHILVKKFA